MPDTRERILSVAAGLIHSRSYADVGVAEICEVADVRKGSFYHYFESKQDLSLCILGDVVEELRDRLIVRAFDPQLQPLDQIDRLAEEVFQVQREWTEQHDKVIGCPVGNLAGELATQDEQVRIAIAQAFRLLENRLCETLRNCLQHPEFRDVDPRATAQAMVAFIEGVLLISKTNNDLGITRTLLPTLRNIRVSKAVATGAGE